MKWRSEHIKRIQERDSNKKKHGTTEKLFAWKPVYLSDRHYLWLSYYYKSYYQYNFESYTILHVDPVVEADYYHPKFEYKGNK